MVLCLASTSGRPLLHQERHHRLIRGVRPRNLRTSATIRAQGSDADLNIDWENETLLFKQRTLKPGQLETLRNLSAEQLQLGRVGGGAAVCGGRAGGRSGGR